MPGLNFYGRLGVSSDTTFDRPHKYVTSPIFRSPVVFASLRLGIGLYIVVTLLVTLIWKSVVDHDGKSYFSYFTYLTYTGLCAYYFAAGTQTLSYSIFSRKAGAGAGYPLQRWPRILQALHVILQSTVVTFPIVVTIVFWSLLASPSTFATPFTAWSNISIHAMNSVFALFEILLTNSPPAPWLTLPISILFLIGYLGVAYITHVTQGFYTYAFLDPKKQGPKLAAYIIGIAVAEIIVFLIIRGVVVLRQRWAMRRGLILQEEREGSEIEHGWEEVESPTNVKASGDLPPESGAMV